MVWSLLLILYLCWTLLRWHILPSTERPITSSPIFWSAIEGGYDPSLNCKFSHKQTKQRKRAKMISFSNMYQEMENFREHFDAINYLVILLWRKNSWDCSTFPAFWSNTLKNFVTDLCSLKFSIIMVRSIEDSIEFRDYYK